MKIAILTLPLHTNYGGILQAYALQTTLKKNNCDVTIVEEKERLNPPLWKLFLLYIQRCINKFILRRNSIIFYERKLKKENSIVRQYTNHFINKYINREIYDNYNKIKPDQFDGWIVGSDQIWRSKYMKKIEQSYLSFAESWNIKRIAYAPSFGTDNWEYSLAQTEHCKNLIHKFDLITVREKSGIKLGAENFNIEAQHVLDPTMLLETKDYLKLIDNYEGNKSRVNLIVYLLDPSQHHLKVVENIALQKNYIPFHIYSKAEDIFLPLEERIQPPVEEWLKGFDDAKFIITDSFHATVFAIIFNKPFIVLMNNSRGNSRLESMLSLFQLNERIMKTADNYKAVINNKLDWNHINKRISDLKERSLNILLEHIN